MLLFKENARERERERERGREESRFVGFLFEIGSKTCVRITRLLSRSVQIVEEEEEEEDEKKRKRGYILSSSSPLRYAQRTLLKYKTKKAQNCSGASLDDERRKKKENERRYIHNIHT